MALRRDLPAELKEKVKNFILSYDNAAYYKGVMGAADKRCLLYTSQMKAIFLQISSSLAVLPVIIPMAGK